MAQNLFAYVRMPEEELFVELYCDMEQLQPDHEPRRFPDDPHASNAWGELPPRSYFRFDEEAIRSEAEQREALAAAAGSAVSVDQISARGRRAPPGQTGSRASRCPTTLVASGVRLRSSVNLEVAYRWAAASWTFSVAPGV